MDLHDDVEPNDEKRLSEDLKHEVNIAYEYDAYHDRSIGIVSK